MSIMNRLVNIVTGKVNTALDAVENPAEMLDLSVEKLNEQLHTAKAGLAEVMSQSSQLEMQIKAAQDKSNEYSKSAQLAVEKGMDDLARQLLTEAQKSTETVNRLQDSLTWITTQETQMKQAVANIDKKLSDLRTNAEVLKAQHSVAVTETRVSAMLSGIGDNGTSDMLQRAQDKVQKEQAKAKAYGDISNQSTSLEDQVKALNQTSSIEDELASLKAKVNQTTV